MNMFAQAMNMGRTKLFLKVKGITGQTPNDFILNIRLKKAQILLKQIDTKTVSEIAYEVGFNSPSYFIKRFRELFGVTPAQYQKGENKLIYYICTMKQNYYVRCIFVSIGLVSSKCS